MNRLWNRDDVAILNIRAVVSETSYSFITSRCQAYTILKPNPSGPVFAGGIYDEMPRLLQRS